MVDLTDLQDISQLSQYWACRSAEGLSLQDAVHGQVQLGPTAKLLCDSAPVQRLRGLAQLGCTRWVFPSAEHSRFGHCLGTAHLAVAAAAHLASTGHTVRPDDVEMLEAAALWHDVGHGPFSHTFESCFLPAVRGNHCWRHEDMSARLLEYAVDQQCIDISRQQLQLIHRIISGSSSNGSSTMCNSSSSSQQWDCSDAPWMLQIVANATNGVDVDKIDYLQRDALMAGVGQRYDFTALLSNCKVVDGQLCFHESQQASLAGLFQARAAMHGQVYQHRSAKAAELMVVDALLAADPVLGISRDADDPESFLTLDDSLLGEIKRAARQNPQCPHLRAAAAILRRLDSRDLYLWVVEVTVPEQFVLERDGAACALSAADIISHQDSNLGVGLTEQDLRVSNMRIDFGKGKSDPLDYTRLYSSSSSSTWPALQGIARPAAFMQRKVRVYIAKQCQSSEQQRYERAVQTAFQRAAQSRFGSSVHICCKGDGSSSSGTAGQKSWQQQQQQFGAPFALPSAAAAQSGVLQGGAAAAAAGLVSWLQSPMRPQQQRLRLQAAAVDEHMSEEEEGSDDGGDSRMGGQQRAGSLKGNGLGAGKISAQDLICTR